MVMMTDAYAVVSSPEVDSIDDEFFALIYSDEELLRDEFDALIAAAWTSPPPTPAHSRGAEHPPDGPRPDLPPSGGRLQMPEGAGRRTLAGRTRAPPEVTDDSPPP
jgi:hypothetical protein